MYDRTTLRAAAERRGDTNSNRVAVRLRIPRMTAHRLWNGTAAPSAEVAAAVQREYRVKVADLLKQESTV
jgi:hypothetical protein